MLAVLTLLLAGAAATAADTNGETRYERFKPSLFTIEVHSGNEGAKSTVGSGYLVSRDGLVATNYHVVGSYIDEPDRYSIRAISGTTTLPASLVSFDLVNDLAILRVPGTSAPPLALADAPPPLGSAIVSFGNPEDLGLSLINGVFNGSAAKGVVDRMLVSMPLNSGMSGGPILDGRGQVAGTNVSVMREANSLSFGVPVARLHALLRRPQVGLTRTALLAETDRQLREFEAATSARLIDAFDSARGASPVAIGHAQSRRPPDLFQCWDGTQEHRNEAVTDSWYRCDLQFSPTVEGLGTVGDVKMMLQQRRSEKSSYGFYDAVRALALSWTEVEAVSPTDEVRRSPHCVSSRFVLAGTVWKANTCVTGYAKHPGIADYELIAASVSDARDAFLLYLSLDGLRQESFEKITRRVLEGITPVVQR
jgi:serine protease Do